MATNKYGEIVHSLVYGDSMGNTKDYEIATLDELIRLATKYFQTDFQQKTNLDTVFWEKRIGVIKTYQIEDLEACSSLQVDRIFAYESFLVTLYKKGHISNEFPFFSVICSKANFPTICKRSETSQSLYIHLLSCGGVDTKTIYNYRQIESSVKVSLTELNKVFLKGLK